MKSVAAFTFATSSSTMPTPRDASGRPPVGTSGKKPPFRGVLNSPQIALNGTVDLKSAAEQLGVHYQTAYRWVRDGSLIAMKVDGAYEVDPAEIKRMAAQRATPVPPPRVARVRNWSIHLTRLYDALITGDERTARVLVERLRDGGIESVEICTQMIAPAMRRIGDRWARGEVSLAEEHRASAISTALLATISVHLRGRPRGVAVVTTVPGEAHALPSMMASLALRADRWQVHYLGTQVPYDQLVELARQVKATLVVLSVADTRLHAETRRWAERVEEDLGVACLVGRPGASLRDLCHAAKCARAA